MRHLATPPTGVPWQVNVAGDGSRVVFLRSPSSDTPTRLCVYDVATAIERPVADLTGNGRPAAGGTAHDPPAGYGIDAAARLAVFAHDGQLHRTELDTGEVATLPTSGPVADPRPDPTGQWIGYLTGRTLRVRPAEGDGLHGDALLAGEPDPRDGGQPYLSWGCAGWWWAPDGRTVLAARTDTRPPHRQVSLHLLDLDGGWVDVHWDRETYPHLATVSWCDHSGPVVAVLRRSQQHGLVLAVDPRTGETQVHAELADPRWVEPIGGTPRHLPDGRVLVGGELAHDGYDARCLFADGALLTPPALYVRRVVGRLPGGAEILVEASAHEPSEQHLYRVDTSVGAAAVEARPVTSAPGWHRAEVGGDTVVIGSESLDHFGTRWAVWRGGAHVGELLADPPPAPAPRPVLQRVTDRRLPAGVLYPPGHVSGRRVPVLLELAGGFGQDVRAARAAWLPRQCWADAGFAVVTVDHRGTPGVAPSFEKVVHRRVADLALADLVEALEGLAAKHPDLDLDRVAVRGDGIGGWLAVMAALRRPEAFRCAAARAPLVDWAEADPVVAERYLGVPESGSEVYRRHCLHTAAAEAPLAAPLLLSPDPDSAGPLTRLTTALTAGGHAHTVLPAAAHTAPVELEFLRGHTAAAGPLSAPRG